jgi:uncharacterized protein (TIGR03083 family)
MPAQAAGRPVAACPGWTAADVAAHVLTVHRRALGDRRRSATPDETAALNEACLRELPERDPVALADLLEADGPASFAVLRGFRTDASFRFHGGLRTTVVPVSAVILAELLVHGLDLATAIGVEWTIPADAAALVLNGMATPGPDGGPSLLDAWLAPGSEALVAGGVATSDPVTILTTVFNRTEPTTPALAALAGAVRAP